MKGERCTIERPLFVSSANFQLINICLRRLKKVRFYLHTLTSQQKIRWYRVEYITLFCNGFTGVRSTPKGKAAGSTPVWDILRRCEGCFCKETVLRILFYPTVQFSTFGACAVQSVLSPGHNKSGFDCSKPLYNCGSGNSLGELSFPANRNQIL